MAKTPHKGQYTLRHPEKYIGDPNAITYRSGWERDFMRYCDEHLAIKKWASEEIVIPYFNPLDNRQHRYFPDFYLEIETKTGDIIKMVIEIKPFKQTILPKPPKKQTPRYLNEVATYVINEAKWKAAKIYCDANGLQFKVMTENELYGKKTK